MSCVRYLVKCKLNPNEKDRLARGKISYEGMQAALREATIDENNVVQFIEICYCLEGGIYPMAMEIPVLNQYLENVSEVKDARFRDQCTMECEFCDCTRSIKLPGKQLMNELSITQGEVNFADIGRIKLNRKKQKEGIKGLKILHNSNNTTGSRYLQVLPFPVCNNL